MRPDRLARSLTMLRRWGPSPAAAYSLAAIRQPQQAAIVDDRGTLTFVEMHERTNALARALRASGVCEGDTVAIMCRNHRGFIEASVACSKLGAHVVYMDTAFDARHVTDVMTQENPVALIHDDEFTALVREGSSGRMRFIAWCDPSRFARPLLLEELIAGADTSELKAPRKKARAVSIASGTGGGPQRTHRRVPSSLVDPAPLLRALPLHTGETTILAAPMCHLWGFLHMKLGLRLASTLVLRCRFDPEEVLFDIAQRRAVALALLPEMLQSVVELPGEMIARYDISSLRVIAVNGATLPAELAMPAMERFGAVLYNLNGQPEVCLNDYRGSRRRVPLGVRSQADTPQRGVAEPESYVARRLERG
jgi:acyl-CoA synthetase (AMP-forming)/AMP-acid ligase II